MSYWRMRTWALRTWLWRALLFPVALPFLMVIYAWRGLAWLGRSARRGIAWLWENCVVGRPEAVLSIPDRPPTCPPRRFHSAPIPGPPPAGPAPGRFNWSMGGGHALGRMNRSFGQMAYAFKRFDAVAEQATGSLVRMGEVFAKLGIPDNRG